MGLTELKGNNNRNIRDYLSISDQKLVMCMICLLADTELGSQTERLVGGMPEKDLKEKLVALK